MIDVKEFREEIISESASSYGLSHERVIELLDALEDAQEMNRELLAQQEVMWVGQDEKEAALGAAAALAEKLEAAVNKHGCVWVKPYYSEYKEMLVLLDNYRAARGEK